MRIHRTDRLHRRIRIVETVLCLGILALTAVYTAWAIAHPAAHR